MTSIERMQKQMMIRIGHAAKMGATKEEIDVLCEATKIMEKYFPIKKVEGLSPMLKKHTNEEYGKMIVNSKERRIELV